MSTYCNAYKHQNLPEGFGRESAKLSDEKKAQLLKEAQDIAAKLVHFADAEEDFAKPYIKEGVTVSVKSATKDSPLLLVRGKTAVPGTINMMQRWQAAASSAEFCTIMSRIDPIFLDGRHIALVSGKPIRRDGAFNQQEDAELPFCAVRWSAFSAPWPVWSRDLLHLEYDCQVGDAFVQASASVTLDDCPELEKTNELVRAHLYPSGYVWRQVEENMMEVTYIVQMDAKGSIPNWIQNAVAPQQALNVCRIRDSLVELEAARVALDAAGGKLTTQALSLDIASGKQQVVDITVPGPGWKLQYEAVVKNKDIGIAVEGAVETEYHKPRRGGKERVLQTGTVTAAGTQLRMVWDNSYSRMTAKTVYGRHVLIPPPGWEEEQKKIKEKQEVEAAATAAGGAGGGAGAADATA